MLVTVLYKNVNFTERKAAMGLLKNRLGSKDRILDDIARMAGGAASVVNGAHQNIRADMKAHIDEVALRLDLVPREDFDRLQERVDALEKQIKTLTKT